MHPCHHRRASNVGTGRRGRCQALLVVLGSLLMALSIGARPAWAAAPPDAGSDYSPAVEGTQIVAQGVFEVTGEELVWRTVRDRAAPDAEASFEQRRAGFVLAMTGPLLLTDEGSGQQVRLGPGEAAMVPAGTNQRRGSLSERATSYLAIELVPAAEANDAGDATVLQSGQPFVLDPGGYDVDLIRGVLTGTTATLPDTGHPNVVLITDGTASVGAPGADPATLLAGEAAVFAGVLDISPATANASTTFAGAFIGPTVSASTGTVRDGTPRSGTPAAATGTVSVLVLSCPDGMTAQNIDPTACAPSEGDFDITLSGDALPAPLTLADASVVDNTLVWEGLPFGDYLLAEAVLPDGYATYVVGSATGVDGSPETGYQITVAADTPTVELVIANLTGS